MRFRPGWESISQCPESKEALRHKQDLLDLIIFRVRHGRSLEVKRFSLALKKRGSRLGEGNVYKELALGPTMQAAVAAGKRLLHKLDSLFGQSFSRLDLRSESIQAVVTRSRRSSQSDEVFMPGSAPTSDPQVDVVGGAISPLPHKTLSSGGL